MKNQSTTSFFTRPRQRGVSLIEAMVAFVILGLSILAFTRIQVNLRSNADVSMQRAEAVRLAQEKLDEFRDFSYLVKLDPSDPTKPYPSAAVQAAIAAAGGHEIKYFEDLVDGQDVISKNLNGATAAVLNTEYTRVWDITSSKVALGSTSSPEYKTGVVTVSWVDRTGATQSVVLRTVVAGIAPIYLAQTNSNKSSGTSNLNPMRRNPKIPVQAVDLGNGKSGFIPPGNNTTYYVMDNTDASLFQQCTLSAPTSTLTQAEYDAYQATKCETAPGYFVAGSVSFDIKDNKTDNLLDSGGHRPADPPDTVCDYYNDANGKSLITGTATTIAQAYNSVVLAMKELVYYALTVSTGTSTPANSSTCQSTTQPFVLNVSTDQADSGYSVSIVSVSGATVTNTTDTLTVNGVWSSSVLNANSGTATVTFTPTGGWPAGKNISVSIPINGIVFTLEKSNQNDKIDKNTAVITKSFGVGAVAPSLVSVAPSTGSTITDVNSNFTLTFDQNMAAGSGLIKLYRVKNGTDTLVESFSLPTATNVTVSGKVVTLDPVAALINGETYYITVDSGALKTSGTCSANYAGFTDSSTLRVTTGPATTTSACPTSPLSFIGLTIDGLSTANPSGGSHTCYSDSLTAVKSTTTKYVSYFCVVLHTGTATPDFTWSGNLKVQGPAGWLSSSNYQVCRYTNPNGDGTITNDEHPASYINVNASLTDQNFLILKGNQTCPSQVLSVTKDISIYFNTVKHQPAP